MQLFDTSDYAVEKGGMKASFKTNRAVAESIAQACRNLKWPDHFTIVDGASPLKRCADLIHAKGEFIFDTETSGLLAWKDRVLGVSVWAANEAFVIPLEHTFLKCIPHELFKKHLGEAFADFSVRRMNHNIKFDMHFIRQSGMKVGPAYCDTLLQSLVINPDNEQAHGLKELAVMYGLSEGGGNYTAQFGKTMWSHIEPKLAAYYACLDVELVTKLKAEQDKVLAKRDKLSDLFWNVEMPMLNLTYEMEKTGIRVDREYVKTTLKPTVYQGWAQAIEAISPLIEPHLGFVKAESVVKVLDSPTKLEKVFFDKLAVPQIKHVTLRNGPEGPFTKRTLDKEAIAGLKATNEPMKLLGEYRKWNTIKKMFVDALPSVTFDGRIHPSMNCIGAATGRMSCSGPNLQQIPSRMGPLVRNMFIPEDGNVFMSADFSSQEMRILSHYCKDPNLVKMFTDPEILASGLDVYSILAIDMFKVDKPEDFNTDTKKKSNPRRAIAKALVLGLGYGMGPKKFARNTGISDKDAKMYYEQYHKTYPGVKRFQEGASKFARKHGYITTLLGRQRPLYEINNTGDSGRRSAAERAASNTPIQGTAADMVKVAALAARRLIQRNKWPVRLVLLIHDEILYEMPAAWAKANPQAISAITKTMETALPLCVPMKSSATFEPRWGSEVDVDDLDDLIDDLAA